MKKAIINGFVQAEKEIGEELPRLCNETYALTMKKLDELYKKEANL